MELQWSQKQCPYLQTNVKQVQNQEQTQEIRLSDGMPDIGRVLCAWGQPVIRSKEWRSDSISVSGGVNASVLYAPEDGSSPRCVEAWLPLQMKWNMPQSHREGAIRTQCLLHSIDARTLSARKLMVRATVGVFVEAMELSEATVFVPEDLPQQVELLTKVYPVELPREAGEKQFVFEDELHIPEASKWISWQLCPEITEQNVVGNRAVFRGVGQLHYVYLDEEGGIHSGCHEIPFAQFADLDKDYDKEATLTVLPTVSSVEPEQTAEGVHIQCSMIAQYLVWDRVLLELAEDAYSPYCAVEAKQQMLCLPVALDSRQEMMDVPMPPMEGQVLDMMFLPNHPKEYRQGDEVVVEIPGMFQLLYMDGEGNLQSTTQPWCGRISVPAAADSQITATMLGCHLPETIGMNPRLHLQLHTTAKQEMPMLSGLTMGQPRQPDDSRPVLILRRVQSDSLWEIAKESGSTMSAIRKANQLETDPEIGQMLLIPVC